MLYRQKFDTFIRIYDEAGYITNRGNFKDQVTDKSGAFFLRALSRTPKELNEMVTEIAGAFINANYTVVEQDARDFFKLLEEDGFIVSGETPEELDRKDVRFSYSELMPKTIRKDFTPEVFRADKDTQDYLENHFKNNPQLTQFQIELTSRCNEQCMHCYIPHKGKIHDIGPQLYCSVLAQCRPLDVTIDLLRKYSNVYCDTAFTPKTDIQQIASFGLKDKIIFGSDFPITHFFRTKYPKAGDNSAISLKEQYAEDIGGWGTLKNTGAKEETI